LIFGGNLGGSFEFGLVFEDVGEFFYVGRELLGVGGFGAFFKGFYRLE
jgi:hypothetical protein